MYVQRPPDPDVARAARAVWTAMRCWRQRCETEHAVYRVTTACDRGRGAACNLVVVHAALGLFGCVRCGATHLCLAAHGEDAPLRQAAARNLLDGDACILAQNEAGEFVCRHSGRVLLDALEYAATANYKDYVERVIDTPFDDMYDEDGYGYGGGDDIHTDWLAYTTARRNAQRASFGMSELSRRHTQTAMRSARKQMGAVLALERQRRWLDEAHRETFGRGIGDGSDGSDGSDDDDAAVADDSCGATARASRRKRPRPRRRRHVRAVPRRDADYWNQAVFPTPASLWADEGASVADVTAAFAARCGDRARPPSGSGGGDDDDTVAMMTRASLRHDLSTWERWASQRRPFCLYEVARSPTPVVAVSWLESMHGVVCDYFQWLWERTAADRPDEAALIRRQDAAPYVDLLGRWVGLVHIGRPRTKLSPLLVFVHYLTTVATEGVYLPDGLGHVWCVMAPAPLLVLMAAHIADAIVPEAPAAPGDGGIAAAAADADDSEVIVASRKRRRVVPERLVAAFARPSPLPGERRFTRVQLRDAASALGQVLSRGRHSAAWLHAWFTAETHRTWPPPPDAHHSS